MVVEGFCPDLTGIVKELAFSKLGLEWLVLSAIDFYWEEGTFFLRGLVFPERSMGSER